MWIVLNVRIWVSSLSPKKTLDTFWNKGRLGCVAWKRNLRKEMVFGDELFYYLNILEDLKVHFFTIISWIRVVILYIWQREECRCLFFLKIFLEQYGSLNTSCVLFAITKLLWDLILLELLGSQKVCQLVGRLCGPHSFLVQSRNLIGHPLTQWLKWPTLWLVGNLTCLPNHTCWLFSLVRSWAPHPNLS